MDFTRNIAILKLPARVEATRQERMMATFIVVELI